MDAVVRPPKTVLILTAGVGAGHEAIGRDIGAAVEAAGHHVIIHDGLRRMGGSTTWLIVRFYAWQIAHAPRLYDAIFFLSSLRPVAGASRRVVSRLYGRRLLDFVERTGPDVVVSTYPLVTVALGRLIAQGRLRRPLVATISDFGIHPLWITPEAAVHLVPSLPSAELVARAGARVRVVRFPIATGFRDPPSRERARATLDLPNDAFIPLIVGGAWGVGDLAGAVDCAVAAGSFPVVVTGRNTSLRIRLESRYRDPTRVRVLGWSECMPELMAAADCLVQNAGGVTCLEAIERKLPIVIYRPIPGHGRRNARIMVGAGVATLAPSAAALRDHFLGCTRGTTVVSLPRSVVGPSVASLILSARAPGSPPGGGHARLRRVLLPVGLLVLLVVLLAALPVVVASQHVSLPLDGAGDASGRVRSDVQDLRSPRCHRIGRSCGGHRGPDGRPVPRRRRSSPSRAHRAERM